MRVVTVNTLDYQGGAARAAYRLTESLRFKGIDALMLVHDKSVQSSFVHELDPWAKYLNRLTRQLDILPLRIYAAREPTPWGINFLPNLTVNKINDLKPDIVHLHWISASFVSLGQIREIHAPIVWTMHDSWAFTGGCHLPSNCGRYEHNCGQCPQLNSGSDNDLSTKLHGYRKQVWSTVKATIICPSNWIASCVRRSTLLKQMQIEVIPNGLDLSVYKPSNKATARARLHLPEISTPLILFGAMHSTKDKNKGYDLLKSALKKLLALRPSFELVIFGSNQIDPDLKNMGVRVHSLGTLNSDSDLVAAYSASDVFVLPSRSENLPYALIEAIACGTPCVAFEVGGVPEILRTAPGCYLVPQNDTQAMANAMAKVLTMSNQDANILANHAKQFEVSTITDAHIKLYERVLSK